MTDLSDWHPRPARFSPADLAPGRIHAARGYAMPLSELWARDHTLPQTAPAPDQDGASVVVLGGAGHLGFRLVADLLSDPVIAGVTVVSRNPSSLLDRAKGELPPAEALRLASDPRLSFATADLSKDDAGRHLATGLSRNGVGRVFNLTAHVDAFAHRKRLDGPNVRSAHAAIDLARRLGAKLIHASTLSVFVSSNGSGEDTETWLGDDPDVLLYGGYAQSKAIAESAVAAAMTADLPAQIVRLGLLVPDARSKLPSGHFLRTFIHALSLMGTIPDEAEEAEVDLTPTVQAARAMATIARSQETGIFHYANPKSCTLSTVVRSAARQAPKERPLRVVESAKWRRTLADLPGIPASILASAFQKTRFLERRASQLPVLNADLFQSTGRRYGISRSLASGAPAPQDPSELIDALISL